MNTWTLLAVIDGFEFWTDGDGFDAAHADVFRRRVSAHNVAGSSGEPLGARWESKRWHFDRFKGIAA
jgi:hypothetical protein